MPLGLQKFKAHVQSHPASLRWHFSVLNCGRALGSEELTMNVSGQHVRRCACFLVCESAECLLRVRLHENPLTGIIWLTPHNNPRGQADLWSEPHPRTHCGRERWRSPQGRPARAGRAGSGAQAFQSLQWGSSYLPDNQFYFFFFVIRTSAVAGGCSVSSPPGSVCDST